MCYETRRWTKYQLKLFRELFFWIRCKFASSVYPLPIRHIWTRAVHTWALHIVIHVAIYGPSRQGCCALCGTETETQHDDVIKWKEFPCYWPFVRGIWSPVDSLHKSQRCGALMFSSICAWTNGWVNNRDAGDMRRHRAHNGITVMNLRCCRSH